jgi:hypothetical protein
MDLFRTANGYRLLKMHVHPDQDEAIVLVRLPQNNATPWATYRMNAKGDTASGDYHTDYNEARAAFNRRTYREG